MSESEVGAVFILREKTDRNGNTKRYDIIDVTANTTSDEILADLPAGEYKVVDTNALETFEVEYVTVQRNRRIAV